MNRNITKRYNKYSIWRRARRHSNEPRKICAGWRYDHRSLVKLYGLEKGVGLA